jgi:predicted AAA+ superfamily ATPase
MRRVGKSTLLAQLRQELIADGVPESRIVSINKDLLEWDHIRTYRDLDAEVRPRLTHAGGPRWLFIDEVQEIASWERAVNSYLAEGLADIIITGSNSGLLGGELATLLSGRYVEIPMYPLGFAEFLRFREVYGATTDETREAAFRTYLRYGGMPGIHALELSDEVVFPYLEAILSTVVLKDVVRRYAVRDVKHLERTLGFVYDNVGSLVSARRIEGALRNQGAGITVDTVVNYLGYLTEALLVHRVERHHLKGKRRLEYVEKYYPTDIGLRHGLFGYRETDIAGLLEAVVYLQLRRLGYSVSVGVLDDAEVDFVAEHAGGARPTRLYVQVAYLLTDEPTVEREFGNLERIADNYPKLVLSLDTWFPQERNGIQHRLLWDWLLDPASGFS